MMLLLGSLVALMLCVVVVCQGRWRMMKKLLMMKAARAAHRVRKGNKNPLSLLPPRVCLAHQHNTHKH
jgi:hypothetical protein